MLDRGSVLRSSRTPHYTQIMTSLATFFSPFFWVLAGAISSLLLLLLLHNCRQF
ncbi:hypothetical protein K440DRAFT_634137 [Wilcoxina mikolae CBS 423.85]|nr:hypothetical protein K440DRAFT_634137 [Wilcoxina mikolae CBS 423.85]